MKIKLLLGGWPKINNKGYDANPMNQKEERGGGIHERLSNFLHFLTQAI